MSGALPRRRLMLVVTEDWYFWSHRLGLARAARDAGWDVTVATRVTDHGEAIRAEGFRLVPLRMTRRQSNPLREAAAILQLAAIYRRERPDVIHHVALKPAAYGSLAAMIARAPIVVNMVAGLGGAFTGQGVKKAVARRVLRLAARVLFGNRRSRLIVQNRDDAAFFVDQGIVPAARVHRIPGSGVDCRHLTALPDAEGAPVAALVARMLWNKGIGATVEAARILKARGVPLRLALVGRPDPSNPDSVPRETLEAWQAEGLVEWWGYRDDIRKVWAEAHIALLPTTYGEGIPKSLIEAAACGRAIVTTDWPGCRDLVEHGANGLLVPPRDATALADALQRLAENPEERRSMGLAGRGIVEGAYALEAVNAATLDIYDDMLTRPGAAKPAHTKSDG
ncbi:glycosyltransferase family 4 protein, partial [Caenispirillum salinarum]|uniref:glycosyltransferase family 4 protein n=1 Tax=Caenispirillum salinarum TaxID=859058 RepID=UPI0012673F00